ncbi:hypothetical protein [Streptomyces sp. NPDC020597]|uniref:hypothetical protein n=1 Tax=unclassified Streptomyces TaxID=2593676 RepID=UPI0037B88064
MAETGALLDAAVAVAVLVCVGAGAGAGGADGVRPSGYRLPGSGCRAAAAATAADSFPNADSLSTACAYRQG